MHGKSIELDENGKEIFKGNYHLGKKIGKWEYNGYGSRKRIEIYRGNTRKELIYYYHSEQLEKEFNFTDNKLDGVGRTWHLNGNISTIRFYKNGHVEGIQKSWYENGILNDESLYIEGIPDSLHTIYLSSGQKIEEKKYNKGILLITKRWHPNGQFQGYQAVREGKYLDSSASWFDNGVKSSETKVVFKNNRWYKSVKQWNRQGILVSDENFIDNKLHGTARKWYDNGILLSEENYISGFWHSYNKREGRSAYYFENGCLSHEIFYVNDEPHGKSTKYYINGVKKEEGIYLYNSLRKLICYSQEGRIECIENYKYGKKDGQQLYFYKNGRKKSEYIYQYGCVVKTKFWDENGKISKPKKNESFYNEYINWNLFWDAGSSTCVPLDKPEDPTIYQNITCPEFYNFYELKKNHLNFPVEAREKNIKGVVYYSAIIRKDGYIDDIKLTRGIGGGCDEEALRIIKLIKAKPGKINDKNADFKITIGISFL